MVQIVKLITVRYYTSCCHVLPIRSECSPQHLPLQNFDRYSTDTELKTRDKGTHKVRRLYVVTFTSFTIMIRAFTIMIRTQVTKMSLNAQVKKDEADISAISANKVYTDTISAVVYYSTIYWERPQ
jgi:hypothetical protein